MSRPGIHCVETQSLVYSWCCISACISVLIIWIPCTLYLGAISVSLNKNGEELHISNMYIKAVTGWSVFTVWSIWEGLECFLVHAVVINYNNILLSTWSRFFSMTKHDQHSKMLEVLDIFHHSCITKTGFLEPLLCLWRGKNVNTIPCEFQIAK